MTISIRPLADRDMDQYDAMDSLLRAEGIRATRPGSAMPGTVFLVAEDDGVLVGRARLVITGDPRPEYGHVGLAVHPDHRGKGYATAIAKGCAAVLAAAGIQYALVTAREGNTALADFIEKNGGVFHGTVTSDRGRTYRQYLAETA